MSSDSVEYPTQSVSSENLAPYSTMAEWSRTRRFFVWAAPLIFMGLAWGGGSILFQEIRSEPAEVATQTTTHDGAALYAQHCAYCHGARGDGNGIAQLAPAARNFGEGKFRLASTNNAIPTDDDLLRVLNRGIPGSAMYSFSNILSPDEQLAVIDHVRFLTRTGIYAKLREKAYDEGLEDELAPLAARADKLSTPGDPLTLPRLEITSATNEQLSHGKQVFMTVCSSCHGPNGKGDGPQVAQLKNDDGSPNKPRDLTLGLFKGGAEPERIYTRIMLGMPGTPMPASNNLPPQDIQDLLRYVLTLSKDSPLKTQTTTIATQAGEL